MACLPKLSDGSQQRIMLARDLARLPVWSGNRMIDLDHAAKIKAGLKSIDHLDLKPQHIVTQMKETEDGSKETVSEIVDGQHRVSILKEQQAAVSTSTTPQTNPFDKNDFKVLVIEKQCESEAEIIQQFNLLNTTKAIQWREDPRVAANRYLEALLKRFNTSKKQLIRPGKTRFPQVSVDAVREEAIRRRVGVASSETPEEQAERVQFDHVKSLRELRETGASCKEEETALKAECVLGFFKNMDWLEPR